MLTEIRKSRQKKKHTEIDYSYEIFIFSKQQTKRLRNTSNNVLIFSLIQNCFKRNLNSSSIKNWYVSRKIICKSFHLFIFQFMVFYLQKI